MPDRNLQLALRIRAAVQGADNIEDLRQRFDELVDELQRGEEQANETDRAFGGLQSGIGNVGDALQTLAGLAVVQQFVQINRQSESLRNTLTALFGSTEKSAQEIQYLNETANRLGVAVSDISQSYIGLTTASKGTNLEGQKTREIFEAVIGAMAVMGKSGQEADQALTAIAQTMGKGVIQAEELTGQLEEALPGASRALAAALGITVAELRQMVATGTVVSADVLPALAAELKKTYGAGAEGANTLNAQLARLQNTLATMAIEIGKAGGVAVLTEGLGAAALGATILYGSMKMLATFMGTFSAAVATADFSDFSRTMEEAHLQTRAMIAEVAKFTGAKDAFALTKEEAKKLGIVTDQLAGSTQKAGQAAEQSVGSLTKLQYSYQQTNETLDKALSLLGRQAAAQKGWADVLQAEAELRGDIARQTELAIAIAEKDAATKQKQATETARAASEAQNYAAALAKQADTMPQVLEDAEKDALAKQKEADAAASAAAAASQHAEAVRAANTVILDALGQQGESAESARAKAAQLRAEYEALKAAGAPLSDLASKMDEVVRAEDAARVAARGYREEQAITIQQLGQLKSKLDGSLGAQVAYNTALDKYAKQQQTAADQTERRNRLMEGARQADIAATRAAADLAEARGNEAEASRLRNVALEQELSLARDEVGFRRQELESLQQIVAAKELEAQADNVLTQAEQESIQAAKDAAASKQNEVASAEAAVIAKEAEVEANRRGTETAKENTQANKEQAQSYTLMEDAATGALRELSGLSKGMNDLLSASLGLQDIGKLFGSEWTGELGRLKLQLDQTLGAIQHNTRNAGILAGAFLDNANAANAARKSYLEQAIAAESLGAELTALTDSTDSNAQNLADMVAQAQAAKAGFGLLDDERLENLQRAIDGANDRIREMQGLTRDARDQLAELNAEIAAEKGDTATADRLKLRLDQTRALADAEQKILDAQAAGNTELIALYEEQKRKLEELYQLKEKNLESDIKQRNNQNAPATTGGHTTGNTGGQTATSQPSGNGAGGMTVNNTFLIDPTKLTSESWIRRFVLPTVDNVVRRKA